MARTLQQGLRPAAYAPRVLAGGQASQTGFATANVLDGQSVTGQLYSTASPNQSMLFEFTHVGVGAGALHTDNLLPQRSGGANVGANEASFLVVGPYHAIYPRGETFTIPDYEYLNQIFVQNNSGGSETIFLTAQVRVILPGRPVAISDQYIINDFSVHNA